MGGPWVRVGLMSWGRSGWALGKSGCDGVEADVMEWCRSGCDVVEWEWV